MIKEPKIQAIPKTNLFKLLEDYPYYSKRLGKMIFIEAGFICDLSSIPPVFWPIIGHPLGKHRAAALVHDYVYRVGYTTRKKGDLVFMDILIALSRPLWKRKAMYRFVRLTGWRPFNNYRKLDPEIKNNPNMVFKDLPATP